MSSHKPGTSSVNLSETLSRELFRELIFGVGQNSRRVGASARGTAGAKLVFAIGRRAVHILHSERAAVEGEAKHHLSQVDMVPLE